jgi:hypothetical protein
MLHLQETFSDVVKTDKTGLSKTAGSERSYPLLAVAFAGAQASA